MTSEQKVLGIWCCNMQHWDSLIRQGEEERQPLTSQWRCHRSWKMGGCRVCSFVWFLMSGLGLYSAKLDQVITVEPSAPFSVACDFFPILFPRLSCFGESHSKGSSTLKMRAGLKDIKTPWTIFPLSRTQQYMVSGWDDERLCVHWNLAGRFLLVQYYLSCYMSYQNYSVIASTDANVKTVQVCLHEL